MKAWKLTATEQPFLLAVKLQVLRNFRVFRRTDVNAWGTRASSQTVVDKILLNKMLSHLARAGVSVLGVVYTSWQPGITESCPKCWGNVTPFTPFCHHAVLFFAHDEGKRPGPESAGPTHWRHRVQVPMWWLQKHKRVIQNGSCSAPLYKTAP